MECLEAPAGGNSNIDVFRSISGAEQPNANHGSIVLDGGAFSLGTKQIFTSMVPPDNFIYLSNGAGSDNADYTAGKFLITLIGYQA